MSQVSRGHFLLLDPSLNHLVEPVESPAQFGVVEGLHGHDLGQPEIELAVRQAELSFAEEADTARKLYLGRRLCQALRIAGFVACRTRTWSWDRQTPLGHNERSYIRCYIRRLR